MKQTLITLLAFCFIVSCGGRNQQEDLSSKEEVGDLSVLEKEHLLEKETYADSVNAGLIEDTFKGSARREAEAKLEQTVVKVNYGSPGKRGRVIWNGLVSYDNVWVSGSHWATAVSFSEEVIINGLTIPAGMYGFFTIPGRENWTLILNKNFNQHLADDYNESDDLVRFNVKPIELDNVVQRLTYEIETISDKQGAISLSWDQIKVSLPFTVK